MPRGDRTEREEKTVRSNGKNKGKYARKANGKNDTGRESKYEENPVLFNELAEKMAQLGGTNAQIARGLKIAVSTLDRWERDFPEFRSAINNGRDYWATRGIKDTLKSRAMGYNWEERSVESTEIDLPKVVKDKAGNYFEVRDEKGRKVMVRVPITKTKVTNRHVPGDPACIFFWLTNKQKSEFSHVRVNRIEGEVKGAPLIQNNRYDFSDIGKEELEQLNDTLARAIKQREHSRPSGNNGSGKQSGTA